MLLSLLKVPSVSAGPPKATGIGSPMPINITNRCGVDGAMDHEFMVTLKPPPPSSNGRRTQDLLNYLQGWAHQYDAEDTSNGTTLRKLEANSHSLQVLHFYTATHLGIAVSASDEHLRDTFVPHGPKCSHQTIAGIANDPAVLSIECDCVQRQLTTYTGVPWGLDRIDGVDDDSFDDGDLTGAGVRVYIVDDGVQGSHVDFGDRVVSGHTARVHAACASCQAVNGILPADGTGCGGHGTHVASTVGGLVHGVAKEVTIVPAFTCFKFRCRDGRYECGSGSDIAANLEWALTDCAAHPEARCV